MATSEGSRRPVSEQPDEAKSSPAGQDADRAAEQAEHDGLDEKLAEDVAGPRPDGHAQADLPVALRHRHEHDVHDPDAADDQRDQGNAEEQAGDEADGPLDGVDDLGEVVNREVGGLAGAIR